MLKKITLPRNQDYYIQKRYNLNITPSYRRPRLSVPIVAKLNELPEGSNYYQVPLVYLNNTNYLLRPEIKLLGDCGTQNVVVVPNNNTTILSYTIGEPTDPEHPNIKALKVNAPCEYDDNGNVVSRTWLTFNSYSAEEWANGYHFQGNQWNNFGSPWAYLGGITENEDHTITVIDYEPCDSGRYYNVFSSDVINQTDTVIEDNNGNQYIYDTDVYYDNLGNLYNFEGDIVKSTDRHAYPDNGRQGEYNYILRPQDTTFLRYLVSPEVDELTNVELFGDRYHYTHDYTEWVDRSWEGTICGSASSTGEETIPDGTYRTYKGLYLGESIPFLHITETVIPPNEILGVPEYNKQINTSDTLKYGTVAAASLTVQLDEPIAEAISHSGELYVLYYDYKHDNNWDRLGFLRVDGVEAIDEYSSRLTAHDEVYKLNKYVDDFLENYSGSTTLDGFYRDLLDYCGCWYDTHGQPILNGNFELDNVYHAIKTTGIEVAHYIASLVPGFIHANIDGDLELIQYRNSEVQLNPSVMSNLTYNAYSSDLLDKVRIVANNAILGEDSGDGENIYFISNNPLISALTPRATLDNLAEDILNTYEEIQTYRPAEISMLYMPGLIAGDMPTVITPTGDVYKIAVMAITINGEGVKITSFGTQTYPVESESSAQFINLINDIDQVSGDVENIERATELIGQQVALNTDNIEDNTDDISSLKTRMTTAESNISTVSTQLQNKINNDSISSSNNLTSITINGTTVNNITDKTYIENNSSVSSSGDLGTISLFGETLPNIALKGYVDSKISGEVVLKVGTLTWNEPGNSNTVCNNTIYIGNPTYSTGIFICPTTTPGLFVKLNDGFRYSTVYGTTVRFSVGSYVSFTEN